MVDVVLGRERSSCPPGAGLIHRFGNSGIELFSGHRLGLLGELVEGAFQTAPHLRGELLPMELNGDGEP
jgi:hypothetical protein